MRLMEEGYRPDDDPFTSDSSFDDDIDNISLLPDIKRKPNALRRRRVRLFTNRSFDFNGRMCSKTLVYTSITAALLVSVVLISVFVKPSSSEEFEETVPEKRSKHEDGPELPPEDSKPAKYHDKKGKVFPWQEIRLPPNLVPEKYLIELHPDLRTFKFSGFAEILVKCIEKTNFVFFHYKHMTLSKIEVYRVQDAENMKKLESLQLGEIAENEKLEMVSVNVPGGLEAGKHYIIYVEFNSSLADRLFGFYKSSYKDKKGNTRYLATTHFEPTDARAAFPCFDEPAMKAKFRMVIVRESKYTALSNMPLERSEDYTHKNGQKLVKDHFQESVKMSTYLIAFVVCDFASLSRTTSSGTLVRVWAPPDNIKDAEFALHEAASILAYYEDFFHVKFPLPKQDLIAIPDFAAGAMENWGLITYRSTSLLYNEKESSDSNKQWVSTVVAHELAHQWFGNLVTMKWWNDLWLNEGFASFVENIGASHDNPQWHMMDQFLLDKTLKAMNLDQMSNSHPISVPVHNPNQINGLFDSISYDKGAGIIRMLRSFIGQKAFQHGLQAYLKQHKFGNAETKDLWGTMTKFWKKYDPENANDVSKIMDTWTLQMGFPVVNIKRENAANGQATQSHFLVHPKAKPALKSQFNYRWEIPLTYCTQENKELKQVWMAKEDPSVPIDWPQGSGWIKANYGQKGFYRVNYDKDNWDKIRHQLERDHKVFSDADRAGLLDDAFNLARAGHLKVTTALGLTQYLSCEKQYVPWSSALSNLGYLDAMFCTDKDTYAVYKKYLLQQITPIFKKLGWEDKGSHLQKYLRTAVIKSASECGNKKATEEALKMFNNWMNHGKRISPNLRSIIYAIGVREGGEVAFNFVLKQYQATTLAAEQRKLMFSLTYTEVPELLDRLLDLSLDDKVIRSQDTVAIITSVAGNCHGRYKAWEFMLKKWDILYDRYSTGSFDFSRLVKSVTSHFNTKEMLQKVKVFMNRDLGSAKLAGQQALESIVANIDWMEKNEKECITWMKDHTGQQSDTTVEDTIHEIEDLALEQRLGDGKDDYPDNGQDDQYERNDYYSPYSRQQERYDNDDYAQDSNQDDYYDYH